MTRYLTTMVVIKNMPAVKSFSTGVLLVAVLLLAGCTHVDHPAFNMSMAGGNMRSSGCLGDDGPSGVC